VTLRVREARRGKRFLRSLAFPAIPARLLRSCVLCVPAVCGAYSLYRANLHSHTGYSDGMSVPSHAFVYARDTARIDILGVTDHAELLTEEEWTDIKVQADSATRPGRFLGLRGFEWTNYYFGHVCVWNTSGRACCTSQVTMPQFYAWLDSQPEPLAQFNHPAPVHYDSFAYCPGADSTFVLLEMLDTNNAACYPVALDSGWHVAMAASQDNHEMDWGRGNRLTGIWADSLNAGSIFDALRRMRTFGTQDRNFVLQFCANDSWMGSTITGGRVCFQVLASDPDSADNIRRIDIITNHRVPVCSLIVGDRNSVGWQESTYVESDSERYFFVRVIENDGDYVISSAVWVQGHASAAGEGSDLRAFGLDAIEPNPFSGHTVIRYLLPAASPVSLRLFDLTGRQTRLLANGEQSAGQHSLRLETGGPESGLRMSRGVYFLVLRVGDQQATKKLIVR